MFTEQIAALGAVLRAGGLPDGVAAAFEQLLGSCAATLSSRGTVNLPGLTLRQIPPQGQRADVILPPEFTVRPVGIEGKGLTGAPLHQWFNVVDNRWYLTEIVNILGDSYWWGDTEDGTYTGGGGGAGTSKEVVKVLTDMLISGNTIQVKSRMLTVQGVGDESDWTTVHIGTEDCP